jgi:hypothetical protein
MVLSGERRMDFTQSRLELIRERHRKLILEPRGEFEYPLFDTFEDEPSAGEDDLAARRLSIQID